jgi:predicted transcriptional regulator
MQSTPEICKYKGILTHWKDYPEGSIERAKSLGIDVWSTSKGLETTLQLWETKLCVLRREKPWQALGLKSAEEFVKAVVGKTTREIGKEITKRTQIQTYHRDNPEAKQEDIAKRFGVSQPYVSQVISKPSDSDNLVIPSNLKSRTDQADFRKLPAELREMVTSRQVSLNQAAIQAGIRKKPTPEDQCLRAFKKCSDKAGLLLRLQEYLEAVSRHKEATDGRRLD